MAGEERFGPMLARLRRAEGLSQRRLAELLAEVSGRPTNTRNEISRWENERDGRLPSTEWLRHLADVLPTDLRSLERAVAASRRTRRGTPDPEPELASNDEITGAHEEGQPTGGGRPEMLSRLAAGHSIGPGTARMFMEQLDEIRTLDRKLGAPATHDRLLQLIEPMQSLLSHSISPTGRAPLARALADATALAGWQALDLGDIERAWQLHETSKAAAREADSMASFAHSMAEQACVLLDLGCQADAVELVQAARQTTAGRIPKILDAWLLATEAEAWAAAGNAHEARRSIDQAAEVLPSEPDEHLPYIFLQPAHMARWRGNVLARIGDHQATSDLFRALDGMDTTFIRATSGLECDIAISLLAQGERDEARRHAERAQELAKQTGSVRHRQRVERVVRAA
ncbi:helix-turn-helix domain-containing protein [Flindersiella endophytica]